MAEGKTSIGDDPFDLVELCQMGGIERFVAENPVDTKVLCRLESVLVTWGKKRGNACHL